MACLPEQIGRAGHGAPAHYLSPEALIGQVRLSKRRKRITPELARMLLLLATHYARRSQWRGYPFREDMIGAAMIPLCKAVFKIKPDRNPFSYFTTTIHNSFIQTVVKETKYFKLAKLRYDENRVSEEEEGA